MNSPKKSLKYLIVILLPYLILNKSARGQQDISEYTLPQCIEMALSNSVLIKQKQWQAEIEKANWSQSKGSMLPALSGDIFHGLKQGRSIDPYTNSYVNKELTSAYYSLGTNATLWNGGSMSNAASQNKLTYEASQMDIAQMIDNVTINAIIAYYQILNIEELLSQARHQTEVTEKEVERLQLMLNNGAVAPAVLHDLKGQLANDKLNEVNIKNSLETARVNLCQLINTNYSPNIRVKKLSDLPIPENTDGMPGDYIEDAVANSPMVKATDLRLQSSKKRLRSAIGSRMPSLYFSGSLGTNYSSAASFAKAGNTVDAATKSYILTGSDKSTVYAPQTEYFFSKISYRDQWQNNFNSLVGIGLQIPIMNSLQAKRKVELAQISERQEIFQANVSRIQYRQAIDLAYINLQSARERYLLLSSQVTDFSASFQAAETRFKNGSGTTVDYTTAKNNADRAMSQLITARYDLVLRKKILDVYLAKHSL